MQPWSRQSLIFYRCSPATIASCITFIIISTSSPSVSAKIVAWGNSQWLRVCGEFSEDLACLSWLTGSLPDALYHHPFIVGPVALQKLWYIMHGYNLLIFLKFDWRGTSTKLCCLYSFWLFFREICLWSQRNGSVRTLLEWETKSNKVLLFDEMKSFFSWECKSRNLFLLLENEWWDISSMILVHHLEMKNVSVETK